MHNIAKKKSISHKRCRICCILLCIYKVAAVLLTKLNFLYADLLQSCIFCQLQLHGLCHLQFAKALSVMQLITVDTWGSDAKRKKTQKKKKLSGLRGWYSDRYTLLFHCCLPWCWKIVWTQLWLNVCIYVRVKPEYCSYLLHGLNKSNIKRYLIVFNDHSALYTE